VTALPRLHLNPYIYCGVKILRTVVVYRTEKIIGLEERIRNI